MTNPVVELVPVASLTPNPDNPRTITDERFDALKRSLTASPDHFYARPIIARRDGVIAGGNMRWRAAQALGLTEVPVVYLDLDDEAFALLTLRDNNEYGSWDDQLLAESLWHLSQTDVDLTLAGFDDDELQRLLDSVSGLDTPGGDPDDIPGLPVEAETQLGELIELGEHRLYCGDATDPESYDRLLGGEKANLVVTSPPYNQDLGSFNHSGMHKTNSWVDRMASAYADDRPEPEYQAEQTMILDTWLDYTHAKASVFYNHKPRYRDKNVILPTEWIHRSKWGIRQEIIWSRPGSVTQNARMFLPCDERIYWLTRGDFIFNDTTEIKTYSSVWDISPTFEIKASAPFPVELPERCIRACSKRGGIILDPFAGSGTTLIAAERLGRKARVMEIDPRYCDVVRKRYADYTAS